MRKPIRAVVAMRLAFHLGRSVGFGRSETIIGRLGALHSVCLSLWRGMVAGGSGMRGGLVRSVWLALFCSALASCCKRSCSDIFHTNVLVGSAISNVVEFFGEPDGWHHSEEYKVPMQSAVWASASLDIWYDSGRVDWVAASTPDGTEKDAFDGARWRSGNAEERLKMLDDIEQSGVLTKMDSEEVHALLGKPDDTVRYAYFELEYAIEPRAAVISYDDAGIITGVEMQTGD